MSRNRVKKLDKHQERELRGVQQEINYNNNSKTKYDLSWFKPRGRQVEIVNAMDNFSWVGVQAPSGAGKTSCVVWKALNLIQEGKYDRIVLCKNVTEVGDDAIGLLKGDLDDKLSAHYEHMRVLFTDFMTKGQLECAEKNGNIVFTLPNFLLGATVKKGTVFILDECQNYSPMTLKLLMERVSDDSLLVLCADKYQSYAIKKRPNGFQDLIDRITVKDDIGRYSKEPLFQYVELTTSENQRGAISKRVTEIYSGEY